MTENQRQKIKIEIEVDYFNDQIYLNILKYRKKRRIGYILSLKKGWIINDGGENDYIREWNEYVIKNLDVTKLKI